MIFATSSAGSEPPDMGICGFSTPATMRYNLLASALPGTITMPWAPPDMAASRDRKSNLLICMASPWHDRQFFSRMG